MRPNRFLQSQRGSTLLFVCFVAIISLSDYSIAFSKQCSNSCARCAPRNNISATVFLSAIYKSRSVPVVHQSISGLTVPHHLIAADLIASGFRVLQGNKFDKIIILFPDHFKCARLSFATTPHDFSTFFGIVHYDRPSLARLLQDTSLMESSPFVARDHGLTALLPFVSYFLPNTPILPIAVSFKSTRPQWDQLVNDLRPLITSRTLVVQSTDFSHYLAQKEAARHDQIVLNLVAASDLDRMSKLKQPSFIDSRGALYIQTRLQRDVFGASASVLFNRNAQAYSAILLDRTTSYIVAVYSRSLPPRLGLPGSVEYCFLGNTFFGRGIQRRLNNLELAVRLLKPLAEALSGCRPVVVFNGAISNSSMLGVSKTTLINPRELALRWLRFLGVEVVSLANNHADDLGVRKLGETASILERAGFKILYRNTVLDLGSIRLVGLADLSNRLGRSSGLITSAELGRLRNLNAEPPVIALINWGGEFASIPRQREDVLTRSLVNSGISLIIGTRPHLASDRIQLINDGASLRVFSLGNFIFDQRSSHSSGQILELHVFEQGTFFARLIPLPNIFDQEPVIRRANLTP